MSVSDDPSELASLRETKLAEFSAASQAAFDTIAKLGTLTAEAATLMQSALAKFPAGQTATPEASTKEETGFFGPYAEFAKTLRTWYVAYGIGAPVIAFSQDRVATALAGSGEARTIALLFLLGALTQIVQAGLYKVVMWHLYMGELYPGRRSTNSYKRSEKISDSLKLELLFDVVTLLLFAYATWQLLSIVTMPVIPDGPPPPS